MLRLSSYAILSSRLPNGGYALLNGLTGAMDIINAGLYGVLRGRQESEGCHDVFFDDGFFPGELQTQFLARGHLTDVPHEAERERLAAVAGAMHERSRAAPHFTIVIDTDCNYRCTYCFEKHLQNNHGGHTAMALDKVPLVYRAIEEIGGGKNAGDRQIALYGGEPLNAKNLDVVFRVVETGRAKGFTFSVITNGHCLDTFLPLLGKGGIEEIQVTLDGPRHIHDGRRVALDGSSSYDRIVANLRRLAAETDAQVHVRINADGENAGGLEALFDDMEAEGLLGHPRIGFYVSPVFGTAAPFGSAGVEDAIARLKGSRPDVRVGREYSGDAILRGLLESAPLRLKSAYCGAAANCYIFLPDGGVASCMEALGKEHNTIGHYSESGVKLDGEAYGLWMNRSAASIPQCLDCRYCLVCAGGCPQQAYNRAGSLYAPDCGDFPATYPGILAKAAERFLAANQA